jgi:hypothetical protein
MEEEREGEEREEKRGREVVGEEREGGNGRREGGR